MGARSRSAGAERRSLQRRAARRGGLHSFSAQGGRRRITIELPKGKYLRLRGGAGSTVTARAGSVWITEQDNPRDVVLRPGQSFTLGRRGLALVEAFSDAAILFE